MSDAGAVDQNIRRLFDARERLCDGRFVGDIATYAGSIRANVIGCLYGFCFIDINQSNGRTLRGEKLCNRKTNAAGRAGDYSRFGFKRKQGSDLRAK